MRHLYAVCSNGKFLHGGPYILTTRLRNLDIIHGHV